MVQIWNSNLPDTVLINETFDASFKASAGDGCWSDLYVDLHKTDDYDFSVKAYGTFSCFEGGCACPAVMIYHDTIINIKVDRRGTYIFHIQKNRNEVISDTLIAE
jgi:hypothetical protein